MLASAICASASLLAHRRSRRLTKRLQRKSFGQKPLNKGNAHPSFEAVLALLAQPAPQPLVVRKRPIIPTVDAVSAGLIECVDCALQNRSIRRTVPIEKRRQLYDGRPVNLQAARRYADRLDNPDLTIGALNISTRFGRYGIDGDGGDDGHREQHYV